ncbi:OmpA family protein [Pseudomonas huaxiensis]|uniref:OmpA family protein n=1 Tax=Pseudomonas huaxiensis TaxID=2213017 RepID=UPI000DA6D33F|nr:OmpA family protein [Pseudomonas huaxiensis]
MTALFEMRIRLGGDPRGFDELKALQGELVKLDHPACPDVDWARVEQLCLSLFEQNGVELQTAASFALARSHRCGLRGMAEGVALIEALVGQWPGLWPASTSIRMDILAWLFARLQALLRTAEWEAYDLPALLCLDNELDRLAMQLDLRVPVPLAAFQTVRGQVGNLVKRMQRYEPASVALQPSTAMPERAWVMPVVVIPPAPNPYVQAQVLQTKQRRLAAWLFAAMVAIAAATWFGWKYWLAVQDSRQVPAQPVQLDSLSLFGAGSAELKPGSTKVLVTALVEIKAQPGWLIVISGHADATGDVEKNRELSRARAVAVRDWMQRMGDIPDSCFAIQGFAANQPVTSNDTEAGRAANRRVDIRLVPHTGACVQPVVGQR